MSVHKFMPVVQYMNCNDGGGVEDLQFAEALIPLLAAGEMLIKIEATSLNPVDWKILKGKYRPSIPPSFPYVPCSDVSGVVLTLGPLVTGFSVGDRVVSYLNHERGGGLARYAAAEAKLTAKIPDDLSFAEASGLPIAGLTALQSLRDSAGVRLDQSFKGTILITAASGGVGTYAVQLAKLSGGYVVATCGRRNMELVKSLGADEVLDYKTPSGARLQSSSRCKFDVIIHCASGGISWSTFERVLSPGGVLVDITPEPMSMIKSVVRKMLFLNKTVVPFYLTPHEKDIQQLVHLVRQRKLTTLVDSVFPLSAVKDAWIKCQDGHATGKIVVVDAL